MRVDRAASDAEAFAPTGAFAPSDAGGFDDELPPVEDFGESPEPTDAA